MKKKAVKDYIRKILTDGVTSIEDTYNDLRNMFLIDAIKAIIDDLAYIEIEGLKLNGKPQIMHLIQEAKKVWQDTLEDLLKC